MTRRDITENFIMKKTTTLFMTLLLATAITSCNKDGVYNPKEKIDKIYVDAGSGKYLSEDWTWDNKQLKTINYYDSDGTINHTETFTYSDNRLSQVDNQEYGETVKYTYDKRHLHQASFYNNNVLYMTCLFEYADNKLSDIKVTTTIADKSLNTTGAANPLNYVLPKQSLEFIKNVLNENPARGSVSFEIDFAWDGNNISEIEIELDEHTALYAFEYDDKLNPFRNFLGSDLEETLYGHGVYKSKNNVVAYTLIEAIMGYSFTESHYISYTYDGRFPATRTIDNVIEYFEYE